MKINILAGDKKTEMMFDSIKIKCKEKSFSYANTTIIYALNDFTRYYDTSDITDIEIRRNRL